MSDKLNQTILAVLSGTRLCKAKRAVYLSTSEEIVVCLALARWESLPKPYTSLEAAWNRLDAGQRDMVRAFNPAFRNPKWDTRVWY